MRFSNNKKQSYIFIGSVILTIILSIVTFRNTQQKWLLFRDAENKFYDKSFEEATLLYKKSLEYGFTTPLVFLHLADSLVADGNFPQGIINYYLYLNIKPNDTAVRLLLARALQWNGNIQEAEEEYEKILKKKTL